MHNKNYLHCYSKSHSTKSSSIKSIQLFREFYKTFLAFKMLKLVFNFYEMDPRKHIFVDFEFTFLFQIWYCNAHLEQFWQSNLLSQFNNLNHVLKWQQSWNWSLLVMFFLLNIHQPITHCCLFFVCFLLKLTSWLQLTLKRKAKDRIDN